VGPARLLADGQEQDWRFVTVKWVTSAGGHARYHPAADGSRGWVRSWVMGRGCAMAAGWQAMRGAQTMRGPGLDCDPAGGGSPPYPRSWEQFRQSVKSTAWGSGRVEADWESFERLGDVSRPRCGVKPEGTLQLWLAQMLDGIGNYREAGGLHSSWGAVKTFPAESSARGANWRATASDDVTVRAGTDGAQFLCAGK